MDTKEVIKNVRRIEIRTRGLVNQLFSGEYHSVFKGRGMHFSEVREYQYGDDVRTIDWNVSARFNKPFIKIFEEERELTVMLVVDFSGSQNYGSDAKFKREIASELCAVLAFSALKNNDKVGMIVFTDRIEKFIPPKKGRTPILRILREFLAFQPEGKGTDIKLGLEYLNGVHKKRAIVFLVSDFMDEGYDKPLKISSNRHDLIAVQLYDKREQELPPVGLIKLTDAETGEDLWVDTGNAEIRNSYKRQFEERRRRRERLFRRSNVDAITVDVQGSYIQPLIDFFRTRERRQ